MNTNLRFVIAGLGAEEKGKLFQALLDGAGETLVGETANIYRYIMALQEEAANKKRRMREMAAKSVAARKRAVDLATGDLFDNGETVFNDVSTAFSDADKERKETKERNYNKIKKLFISSDEKKKSAKGKKGKSEYAGGSLTEHKSAKTKKEPFVPPLAEEVRAFAEAEKLCVDPETFVDFYDSRGWKMGSTPIRNWQATVRLWHRRASTCNNEEGMAVKKKFEEESYWHELMQRTCAARDGPPVEDKDEEEVGVAAGDGIHDEDDETELSPFARFMRRIEDNDI